ncbi:MAG: DsrE family protein [Pseudomonadota bacterium]
MDAPQAAPPQALLIIWVSRDREAALNMAFMYAKNSLLKGWWPRVRLVVWGPSAELLVADQGLREELAELAKAGVELQACRACADRYRVSAQLEALGLEVIYVGQPVSQCLQEGWAVLTV